jgi:hypothetical protein
LETVIGWEAKIERSLTTDMPRDEYVERCKQRAFDYLDRGDLKDAVASLVSNMNARPDCELPHYLATLGVLLLRGNDAPGLEDADRRSEVMVR